MGFYILAKISKRQSTYDGNNNLKEVELNHTVCKYFRTSIKISTVGTRNLKL